MNQVPSVEVIPDTNVLGRAVVRNARVAYADGLNAPKAGKPDASGKVGAHRYSAAFLIAESAGAALTALWQVMGQVAVAKWADKAQVIMQELNAGQRLAVRNGAAKASQDGFMGHWFISGGAKVTEPPILLDNYMNPQGTGPQVLTRPQGRIYSGCYVNVQIDFWAQDNTDGGKRINAEIKVVQFSQDGESFGGGAAADTSVFGGVAPPAMGAPGFAMPGAPGGAPQQQPAFAAPQQQPAFAAPGGAPGFAAPGGAPGFAAPQQPGVAAPGGAPGFAAPGGAPSFGAPPQMPGFGAAPQQPQQGFAPPGFAAPGAAPGFAPGAAPGFAPPGFGR